MPVHKKLRDFLEINSEEIVGELTNEIYRARQVNEMQVNAWNSSIENFKNVLLYVKETGLDLIFEYGLPLSNEKIDAVIIGKNPDGKLTAIIIEFKGWRFINRDSDDFVNCDLGKSLSPDYQLAYYLGNLKHCHTSSEFYEYKGIINMYNLQRENSNIEFCYKVFFRNENRNFADFINGLNLSEADEEDVNLFIKGKYTQNNQLFEIVRKHSGSIFTSARKALAEAGFSLSEEQLILINEIEEDINQGNNVTYLIQGSPGSGKTLLAISILLSSLCKNKNSILAFMNNRLIACVRKIFNNLTDQNGKPIALRGLVKFYSTGRKDYLGVADDGYNGNHDVVIYDEAQRMNTENIVNCFNRGNINVIFFDELQRLNYTEKGKLSIFKSVADRLEKKVKERFLKGSYRVEGGEEYNKWLEQFLSNPDEIKNSGKWINNYEFKIFNDFQIMRSALFKKRNSGKSKVALVASFTETPGNKDNQTAQDNIRIGRMINPGNMLYHSLDYNIYWVMKPDEYAEFWVNGTCNELTKCASIYGSQGFEADYIGFVWGRDLVIRNNEWTLGDNCLDVAPGVKEYVLKDLFRHCKEGHNEHLDIVLHLLKNRLRIFLSRGIKGTYVFCEDDETREFLMRGL